VNFAESKTDRVFFARFIENEDLLEALTDFVRKVNVKVGFFSLIGSLKRARLGFFDGVKYQTVEIDKPLEIVSCVGNISLNEEDQVVVHAHMVVSDEKGEAFGGHLLRGCIVSFTAEMVLVVCTQTRLRRALDKKTGLRLWRF
jgi:hypothetical protein